jgi:hypothetical protein
MSGRLCVPGPVVSWLNLLWLSEGLFAGRVGEEAGVTVEGGGFGGVGVGVVVVVGDGVVVVVGDGGDGDGGDGGGGDGDGGDGDGGDGGVAIPGLASE